MENTPFTILGCGIAGGWIAHQLTMIGFSNFILFDGELESTEIKISLMPYFRYEPKESLAKNLSNHIMSINPRANVDVHGFFDSELKHFLKGMVIGAMDSIEEENILKKIGGCVAGEKAASERGNNWFSFGVSKLDKNRIKFDNKPILEEEYYGGYPEGLTKFQMGKHSMDAIKVLFENYKIDQPK